MEGLTVTFHLQEPGATGGYLLERLLQCAKTATRGGAIVAWATESGSRLFLADPVTKMMYERGRFDLIVGTDSITDTNSIRYLRELEEECPGLFARALVHDQPSLFHPKFYWFETLGSVSVFVGSGNLTSGGLKRNWEAFSLTVLEGAQGSTFLKYVATWKEQNLSLLRELNDPEVLLRAAENDNVPRPIARRAHDDHADESALLAERVLIAEIPKSGNRWKQANFDKATYEGFFGAKVGSQRRIVLFEVDVNGTVGPMESRPSVEVASQNYRFELAGARGLYPSIGRPIAIFRRTPSGDFFYSILMPGDINYPSIDQFLTTIAGPAGRTMRRTETTRAKLLEHAPVLGVLSASGLIAERP